MGDTREYVASIEDRPDVQKWIARFLRVARDMPEDVWVFVASGTPTVMARNESGDRAKTRGGGVDRRYIIGAVAGGSWDGGDW